MVILVVGASGATGRLLVDELLLRGHNVRAIVRSAETLPKQLVDENNLTVVIASLLELSDVELAQHVIWSSLIGKNQNYYQ